LRFVELIDDVYEPDVTGYIFSDDYILFAKSSHQDQSLFGAGAVVRDPDEPVTVLHAVRLGDAAFVEKQALVPCRAVVGGEARGKAAAPRGLVVVHEEEIPCHTRFAIASSDLPDRAVSEKETNSSKSDVRAGEQFFMSGNQAIRIWKVQPYCLEIVFSFSSSLGTQDVSRL